MPKSRLFGARQPGEVTLVEAPVTQSYARKARVAFVAVWVGAAVLISSVLLTFVDPLIAVAIGVVAAGLIGLTAAITVRVWPVVRVLWHWSAELVLSLALLAPATVLGRAVHPLAFVGLVAAVAGVCWFVRPVRRWLSRWGWCVVDRHRLRLSFAQFVRSTNRGNPGRLPLILLARPTPAGERVWVWLRPGLDLADLDGKTSKLAVACWAADVRVVQASPNRAALIRVDVTRRDPLLSLVGSPLVGLVPEDHEMAEPAFDDLAFDLGLDLPDVPAVIPNQRTTGRR